MKRPTIMDVARQAGVSKGAVSYALNGQPGVSEQTRRRILMVAGDLGWRPNSVARALSRSRSHAVGLVLARPAVLLGVEPFLMRLISGIQSELSRSGFALMLQVVSDLADEMAVYQQWWGERRIDGVLVVDLRTNDPRLDLVRRLGIPAAVMGALRDGAGLAVVHKDETGPVTEAVEHLVRLGHRRIARIAGERQFLHTQQRGRAVTAVARRLGVQDGVRTIHADYTGARGAEITRQLLSEPSRPTALLFDNDLMAVAAAAVAREMGLEVPRDVSIIAWDDSPLCHLSYPKLTAVSWDVAEYGRQATGLLIEVTAGKPPRRIVSEQGRLIPRGSTGPAPLSNS